MRPRDSSLTLALCCSLAAHGLLFYTACRYTARDPTARAQQPAAGNDAAHPHESGESTGVGKAFNASPGDLPLLARQGPQEQAFLSRDPEGFGSPLNPPSMSVLPPGRESAETAPPAPPALPAVAAPLPDDTPAFGPAPVAMAYPARPAPAPQAPSTPTSPAPAADPAPMSDSESDAFSTTASAVFHNGQVEPRFGRKVKTSRPRIDIAGYLDAYSPTPLSLVLEVKTDDAGNVVACEVLKSSGSPSIDAPCREAMFHWWIEPPKDKSGRPIPDVMIWTLSFR